MQDQGSTRSPQWTHGGVALGPKPRLYKTKLNKKVRRTAMISALSSKVASGDMIVLDKIETSEFKTKIMVKMLSADRRKEEVSRKFLMKTTSRYAKAFPIPRR